MRSLLCCVGLMLAPMLGAQILDTSDTHLYKQLRTYRLSEEGLDHLQEDSLAIDTQLVGFSGNYPLLMNRPFVDLGYEGSPSLFLDAVPRPSLAFDPGFIPFDPYRYNTEIHRYHTDRPFTRLNYSQGQNELIYIEAQHGQQFSERLTLGIDYRRIKNHNFYYSNIVNGERVKFTDLFNTKLYTGYHNPDRTYELLAAYVWNKNDQTVTGGLAQPEDFEVNDGLSKTFNHQVHLSNSQSQFHEHRFKVKQYFRYRAGAFDTLRPYRLDRFKAQWVSESQFGKTTFSLQDQAPDSLYYGRTLDPFEDTIQHLQFTQSIGHQWMWKNWTAQLGMRYAFDQMRMDDRHKLFHSTYVQGFLHGVNWDLNAQIGLTGYNSGDHALDLSYNWGSNIKHRITLSERSLKPFYLQQRFVFAHHDWDRSLDRTADVALQYHGQLHSIWGHFQWGLSSMLIYQGWVTDQADTITQSDEVAQLNTFSFAYSQEWRYGGINLKSFFQQSERIQRPSTHANVRIYTRFFLFKKKLLTHWGVEGYGMNSFTSPVYRADRLNWVQGTRQLPFYAPISVFVNAKVKNFNFGLSFYHILEGELGEAYYSAPYYPVMPRVMRFNIRWDLSN